MQQAKTYNFIKFTGRVVHIFLKLSAHVAAGLAARHVQRPTGEGCRRRRRVAHYGDGTLDPLGERLGALRRLLPISPRPRRPPSEANPATLRTLHPQPNPS